MDGVEHQYLDQLHALTREMDGAMKAIASDDLASFVDSVARQEVDVFNMAALHNLQRRVLPPAGPSSAILAAEKNLLLASQRYAALLKHCGKTISILSELCDSYLGVRKEARGIRSRQQTWSCEV
jgi:hypothetical protein